VVVPMMDIPQISLLDGSVLATWLTGSERSGEMGTAMQSCCHHIPIHPFWHARQRAVKDSHIEIRDIAIGSKQGWHPIITDNQSNRSLGLTIHRVSSS
jgi:hypothetical protein